MPIVQMHPDAQKRAYLRGGVYGPGAAHPAKCQIVDYEFPATEHPRWDKDKKENLEDWCFMRIRVNSDEFSTCDIFEHIPIGPNSGSKLGTWLTQIDVPVEGETFQHNTDDVVGRECAVEMGDPRHDKDDRERFYTGKLLQVMGV